MSKPNYRDLYYELRRSANRVLNAEQALQLAKKNKASWAAEQDRLDKAKEELSEKANETIPEHNQTSIF